MFVVISTRDHHKIEGGNALSKRLFTTIERDQGSAIAIYQRTGKSIEPSLDAVAALRIQVFRDFPYLYDGSQAYERDYLSDYAKVASGLVVTAEVDGEIIGAATGMAMRDADAAFRAPFEQGERVPAEVEFERLFYCAESVLLAPYRGAGIGVAFFDAREAWARELDMRHSCFCAVERPYDHPLRPASYQPLDRFWQRRGYQALADCRVTYAWKDIDQQDETDKTLNFWLKSL